MNANLTTLDYFEMHIKARDCMEHAKTRRKSIQGIALEQDKPALDWQAAKCIARVSEYAIRMRLGQSTDYSICWHCGWDLSRCDCKELAERGIYTHKIEINDGVISYK